MSTEATSASWRAPKVHGPVARNTSDCEGTRGEDPGDGEDSAGYDAKATRELLQAEALRAWELLQDGVIRELYFRGDRPSAVLVLECRDVEEAKQVLAPYRW